MRYLPHTPEEIQAMLAAVGKRSLDELFDSIPKHERQKEPLALDPALDEISLMRHLNDLASKNTAAGMLSFLGAGAYDHHFPQAADQLLLRSEFYTAYTPYQPEAAQGTLQVIFEFQTIVSEILGLPVANASMYDASTALAEAVLMARRLTRRDRMVVSRCVHPQHAETIQTYTHELDHGAYAPGGSVEPTHPPLVRVDTTPSGAPDIDALRAAANGETACVVVGYPSFLGTLCDLRPLATTLHDIGALLVTVTTEPFALALAEPPGALGADIAVAEGQPLGLPPQFGGPGVGLFACSDDKKTLQQMPGRLVGETVDKNDKRGYVLTLATREQHIRRERATSNICTNSGLCATALTIKMCMLGKRGFVETAEQCLAKAEYLKSRIGALEGFTVVTSSPSFNEFAVSVPGASARTLCDRMAERGILAGFDLGRVDPARKDQLLVAVTEKHARADLDRFVAALQAAS
jgi:glycine dehydrogenase subunit 1